MKLIARILLILAAAGAVIGVALALVGTQGPQAGAPQRDPSTQMQAGAANAGPGNAGGEPQRSQPGGGARGGRGASLFGAGEILKDLVIIALIVAIVAPLSRLLGRMQSNAQQRANKEQVR